jgi:DNA polymerase III subunit delta'
LLKALLTGQEIITDMNYDQLMGQDELRRQLAAALEGNKLSHAVLLTGPSGSGKTSWGRYLAQAILCPDRQGLKPCMLCLSCRRFANGNHQEFYYLEPEKHKLKIEQFRAVRERFYLGGENKVCLIDQAEAMTAETTSSLLKILEEPPSGLTFILLAEHSGALFDTILSRCQRYTLHLLNCRDISELLTKNGRADKEKADLLARLSGGLPGYAFKMADDDSFDELLIEAKSLAYNLALGRDSAHQLLIWAASLAEREDLVRLLELITLLYRDGMMQMLCRRGDDHQGNEESLNWIESICPVRLEEAVILINKAIYEMAATNVNRRLLIEKMLITLQRRLSR